MASIFYDLETTDTQPVGQIINYCFTVVDDQWKTVRILADNVRLSRLQLPSAGAILANRVDVLALQEATTLSEKQAAKRIADFIRQTIEEGKGKVPLIGFNSSRFDLLHLRTTFIRNGINPYFRGELVYRDMLHAARRLYCTEGDFPKTAKSDDENATRASLSLENLCRAFGLLEGSQAHESKADVDLTIRLAKLFFERYGYDVRRAESYEALPLHQYARQPIFCYQMVPQYSLAASERFKEVPMTLLDANHRSALWCNLDKFREAQDESAISWFGVGTHQFITDGRMHRVPEELFAAAEQAQERFKHISLTNYFSRSVCDIEQDIYRLDMSLIDLLERAIWRGDRKGLLAAKNDDAREIFMRHRLAEYPWGGTHDQMVEEELKAYALHRYGGRMFMKKTDELEPFEEGVYQESYHSTLNELYQQIDERAREGSEEDKSLLASLRAYYDRSDIVRVAGEELRKIVRIRTN